LLAPQRRLVLFDDPNAFLLENPQDLLDAGVHIPGASDCVQGINPVRPQFNFETKFL
jgi:hypothetical protein